MAGKLGLSLGERKYLTINDTAAYMGLGMTKVKNIIKDREFTEFITVGKSNKVMIDRAAFEKWVVEKGHI